MATDDILNFDRLLAPVSDEKPIGEEDFRSLDATAFFELRKLRDELKKAEDNIFQDDEDEPDGDWQDLLSRSSDALATQTKDVQLVCWMLEALPRVHGFAGLRDGIRLLTRLSELHLEQLFPRPDEEGVHEDDVFTCVEPFDRLDNGPLPESVLRVVVTEGAMPAPFTLWHYEQAVDLSQRPSDLQEDRRKEGWITLDMFETAVRETSDSFFNNLYEDLAQCEESLAQLDTLFEDKCGEQDGTPLNPSVRALRTKLEEAGRSIRTLAGNSLEQPDTEEESSDDSSEAEESAASRGGGQTAPPTRTRESAFRELEDIADFFRKSEPQSILSYQLQQVVRYGRMSLPELLKEILRNEDERNKLFRHVGIEKPSDD
jgi:type VI secretion system protein ImpA